MNGTGGKIISLWRYPVKSMLGKNVTISMLMSVAS